MTRSRLVAASALALGASLTSHCSKTQTRVELRVNTDLPCEQLRGVSVTGGRRGQVEDRAPAFYSSSCSLDGTLGTFLLIPVDEYLDNFELKVVAAVVDGAGQGPQRPDDCTAANGYAGCIVARRAFTTLPEETIYVDVPVFSECRDVEAGCGPERTCVLGACVSALIPDASVCLTASTCDNDILVGGAGGEAGAGGGGAGQGGDGQGGGGQGGSQGGGQGGAGQGGAGQGGGGQGGDAQGGGGQGGAGQGGAGQGGRGGLGGLGGVLPGTFAPSR
jgi:hypothetical protein